MKRTIFFLSIFALIWSSAINSTTAQNVDGKCSAVTDGLQLCADSGSAISRLGEKVSVKLNLLNSTERERVVYDSRVRYNQDIFAARQPYSFVVTDPRGKKLPTKKEELARQVSVGIVPESELLRQVPVYSGPGNQTIAAKQRLPVTINLSQYYDFKVKGKYRVEITLKFPSENEQGLTQLRLQEIELEIK